MSVKHIDKGLDLLVWLNVIDNWKYQPLEDSIYMIYGNLRNISGINHKIYLEKELINLDASDLYAKIIADFHTMKENNGTGFFYKVKNKLKKLSNTIIDYETWYGFDNPEDEVEHKHEQYEAYQLLEKLMDEGKITREDMLRANELWRKYK